MDRLALADLKEWCNKPNRKPLILRGARQVGKSTLVRNFALESGLDLLEINLEKQKLKSLNQEGFDITSVLQEVEFSLNKKIDSKSLIFFDEAQEQKKVLAALRYFYEERPDLRVIAAGSLLDFALEDNSYSVPVGRVEYYYLGPMRFTEFLNALGETILVDYIQNFSQNFIEAIHFKLLRRIREFYFVGGMPEAILTFARTNSPLEVRRIQNAIIQTYQEDFNKYSKHATTSRVRQVFNFVPGHLGQKTKYSEINREEKARDLKRAVELLILARVLIPVHHSNASALPLRSQKDDSIHKLYFLDVGLVSAAQDVGWDLVVEDDSEMLLKGPLAEQFVAQHLFFNKSGFNEPELFYWLRDKKAQNAEVDFVLTLDSQIVPVEVKAGKSGKLKSLMVFVKEKQLPVALRVNTNQTSSELVEQVVNEAVGRSVFELRNLPFYLIEKIEYIFRKL